MKKHKSKKAFSNAFERLVLRIDDSGQHDIAKRLREGFSCLNGLTDARAFLMEFIEPTVSQIRHHMITALRNTAK